MDGFRVRVSCGWSLKLRSAWSFSPRTRWVQQAEAHMHKTTKTVCQPDPLSVYPSICIHLFSYHSVGSSIFLSLPLISFTDMNRMSLLNNISNSVGLHLNQLLRSLRKSTIISSSELFVLLVIFSLYRSVM